MLEVRSSRERQLRSCPDERMRALRSWFPSIDGAKLFWGQLCRHFTPGCRQWRGGVELLSKHTTGWAGVGGACVKRDSATRLGVAGPTPRCQLLLAALGRCLHERASLCASYISTALRFDRRAISRLLFPCTTFVCPSPAEVSALELHLLTTTIPRLLISSTIPAKQWPPYAAVNYVRSPVPQFTGNHNSHVVAAMAGRSLRGLGRPPAFLIAAAYPRNSEQDSRQWSHSASTKLACSGNCAKQRPPSTN